MARTAAALRVTENKRPILDIPLVQIRAFATQPRKHFDPEKLRQLAENIKVKGQLMPAIVRELSGAERRDKLRYELIAGERRSCLPESRRQNPYAKYTGLC